MVIGRQLTDIAANTAREQSERINKRFEREKMAKLTRDAIEDNLCADRIEEILSHHYAYVLDARINLCCRCHGVLCM